MMHLYVSGMVSRTDKHTDKQMIKMLKTPDVSCQGIKINFGWPYPTNPKQVSAVRSSPCFSAHASMLPSLRFSQTPPPPPLRHNTTHTWLILHRWQSAASSSPCFSAQASMLPSLRFQSDAHTPPPPPTHTHTQYNTYLTNPTQVTVGRQF